MCLQRDAFSDIDFSTGIHSHCIYIGCCLNLTDIQGGVTCRSCNEHTTGKVVRGYVDTTALHYSITCIGYIDTKGFRVCIRSKLGIIGNRHLTAVVEQLIGAGHLDSRNRVIDTAHQLDFTAFQETIIGNRHLSICTFNADNPICFRRGQDLVIQIQGHRGRDYQRFRYRYRLQQSQSGFCIGVRNSQHIR